MECFILFIFACLFAITTPSSVRATTTTTASQRWLTGGYVLTSAESRPYLATWVSPTNDIYCIGTIVAPDVVLTTAHCVSDAAEERAKLGPTFVVAGITNAAQIATTPNRREVAHVLSLPRYAESSSGKDFGLLILKTPFSLSTTVAPIFMPETEDADGIYVDITGWGPPGLLPEEQVIRTGQIYILARDEAELVLGNLVRDETYARNSADDVCGGLLSASPLVADNYVYGMASSLGLDCSNLLRPAIYSRVFELSAWVQHVRVIYASVPEDVIHHLISDQVSALKIVKMVGPKKKRRQVITYNNKLQFSALLPRDLRSVKFTLSSTGPDSPTNASNVGIRISLNRPNFFDRFECSNLRLDEPTKICELLVPMEGVYNIDVFPLDGSVITATLIISNLKLAMDFEEIYGIRRVQSVYNSTVKKKGSFHYLAIPAVPNNEVEVSVRTYTSGAVQKLVVSGTNQAVPKFPVSPKSKIPVLCSFESRTTRPGSCIFHMPQNFSSISISVFGDAKKQVNYGLQYTYTRLNQASGFPKRIAYLPLPLKNKFPHFFEKRLLVPGTEFGIKFDLFSGSCIVRMYFGRNDAFADTPDCLLARMTPGRTYFCSSIVPRSLTDGRVLVRGASKKPCIYGLTIYYA